MPLLNSASSARFLERSPDNGRLLRTDGMEASSELVDDLVLEDDRASVDPGDPSLLIIEDDVTFARILLDLAHDRGLKALVALNGSTALLLAREFSPGAITLDMHLPDIGGWTILDRLKHDPATRHIPVHVITGDENWRIALALGAITYLEKSTAKRSLLDVFSDLQESMRPSVKRILLVSPDALRRNLLLRAVEGSGVEILEADDAAQTLSIAQRERIAACVIDFSEWNVEALELIDALQDRFGSKAPPAILFGNPAVLRDDLNSIKRVSFLTVIRYAATIERVAYEAALLLNRTESDLSDRQRGMIAEVMRNDETLAGRKVLIIDDDIRNIFALTSVLEQQNIEAIHAENGRAGIELLSRTPGIDLVLMDVMMPEMDGYETTRAIRGIKEFEHLPIVALTAKAMKGDREKCIEAGASDYIPKPVDVEHLFSVMRVWLTRSCNVRPVRGNVRFTD